MGSKLPCGQRHFCSLVKLFRGDAMQGNEYITSTLLLAALEAEAPQIGDNFWSLIGADAKTCQGLLCRAEPAQACKGLLRPNNAWDGWAGSSEVLFSSLVSEWINPSGPELLWCGASSDVSPSVAPLQPQFFLGSPDFNHTICCLSSWTEEIANYCVCLLGQIWQFCSPD